VGRIEQYPPSPDGSVRSQAAGAACSSKGIYFFERVVMDGLQWVGVIALVSLSYWFVAAVVDTFGGD
jgi:hypothetical protein